MPTQDAFPILVVAFNGKVFGVQRATGAPAWQFRFPHAAIVELHFERGLVVACSYAQVAVLDALTGQVRGNFALAGAQGLRPTIVIDHGHIFVSGAGEVSCYTFEGACLWKQPFKGEGFGVMALGFPGNVRQADDPGSK
jgi:outer membrane protein assembly factor BamB